jgi:hypothetical protein
MRRVLGTGIADYLPALCLWIFTLAYLLLAYRYPPASRAFPVIVAWSMIVLVTLDLASRTQTRAGRALTRWLNPASVAAHGEGTNAARQAFVAVLWVAALVAALVLAGILTAIPLFVFASVRWRGQRSYAMSLAVAGMTTLLIWLLFTRLLRIDLYSGLLLGGG